MRVKVLHIITRLDKGGSSENTLLTCIGLDKKIYDVTLMAGKTVDPYGDLMDEAKANDVRFIFIPDLGRNINVYKDIKAFFKIYSIIRREKYDIVHSHSSKGGFLGRLAAKFARTPAVFYTPHGHIFYGYFNRFLTGLFIYIEKIAAFFTDYIITLTKLGREDWIRFGIAPRGKFVVIPSGLRLNYPPLSEREALQKKKDLGLPDGMKIIGTAGRFEEIKGYKYLVASIPGVVSSCADTFFVFCGDGTLRPELQREVMDSGMEKKVKFLGWRSDLGQVMQIMDIFVLPSLNEAMGRVLVEAMALGKPVVATAIGGVPDIVIDNETGLLVPPKNPEAIQAALVRLLKDADMAKRMSDRARESVFSKFGAGEMVDKIQKLYRERLENYRKSRSN